MERYLPHYIGAFALTLFLIHIFRSPAERVGLVDLPGGRKKHEGSIPLIGGIAIFAAFAFVALFIPEPLRPFSTLFMGMGILLIAGVLDDLQQITSPAKLLVQGITAVLMVAWGDVTITHLGNLLGNGDISLGAWSFPFTAVCVIGFVNAFNMLDGIDGLAGAVLIVIAAWLATAAGWVGMDFPVAMLALLIATVSAFLVLNFRHPWCKKAYVFMGDAGSLMLGFAIAWFAVRFSQGGPEGTIPPIVIAWILALPVFDTVSVMVRRLLKRQSPFLADRKHLHHICVRAGYSHSTTVNLLIGVTAACGGVGVAGWHLGTPEPVLSLLFVAAFLVYIFFVLHAWKTMKVLRRLRTYRRLRERALR